MPSLPAPANLPADLLELEPVWLNEPTRWRRSGAELLLTTDGGTDFWRRTHYGFVRDSGHHYGVRVPGEFTVEAFVQGQYRDQYDQAGLMVRLDAERWVKCGVELVDGRAAASVVVTHGVSDWSMTELDGVPDWLGLRLTRSGDALIVQTAVVSDTEPDPDAARPWTVQRMAYLPAGLPVSVGPMAASPQGQGFEVRLRGLRLVQG